MERRPDNASPLRAYLLPAKKCYDAAEEARSDDVLILHDRPGVEPLLRAKFPDRRFYRMHVLTGPPHVVLVPLNGGPPVPWLQ